MSPRDIASLAYKLAGVYAIVQFLNLLSPVLTTPLWWSLAREGDPPVNVPLLVAGQVIPVVLMAALGLLLILKSRYLAGLTVGEAAPAAPRLSGAELHAVLFSVIGVLILGLVAPQVPKLFHNLAVLASDYGLHGHEERRAQYLRGNWLWLTGICLQLLIGGFLLFRARQLVSLLRWTKPSKETPRYRCPHCGHPYSPDDYRPDVTRPLCSECRRELPKGAGTNDD